MTAASHSVAGGKAKPHTEPQESGLFENYLRTRDVAARYGVTPETVRNWVYQGRLRPSKRLNKRDLLFTEAAVAALAEDVPERYSP